MLDIKLLLLLNESLIFGIFALGIYMAFEWLKFPDLTPDGSFVTGPCVYVILCSLDCPFILSILGGILSGFILGAITAGFNKYMRIPTIISGLITSTACYSLNLMVLGKPNKILDSTSEFFSMNIIEGQKWLLIVLIIFLVVFVFLFQILGNSTWGLRLRAVGENSRLAKDIGISERKYYLVGLGLANALVALSGILFVQRSYTVDVNMGIGYTIVGLIAMIFGLMITTRNNKVWLTIICILLGAFIYKFIVQITLEMGLPTDSFRLISAFLIILMYFIMNKTNGRFLSKLRWS